MIQIPEVVGLALCKRIDYNLQTGLVSLVGIFQAQRFRRFPSPPQSFTGYVALTDGVGEGILKLAITEMERDRTVYSYKRWFTFSDDRLLVVNVELPVERFVFEAPGRYAFTLSFDNQYLTERSIRVYSE